VHDRQDHACIAFAHELHSKLTLRVWVCCGTTGGCLWAFTTSPGGSRFLATKVVLDSAIMGSIYVIGEGTAQRNGTQATKAA